MDFAILADHRVKLKESEKKDKYQWNIKVTFLPIMIVAIVTKGLIKGQEDLEIKERAETIQTTALFRSAGILRRIQETWGDLQSLRLQWKTIR